MLREWMRKRLIQVSYNLVKRIDYFSKDGFKKMIDDNNQDIDNTIKDLEKDKKNLEINGVEITRKDLFSNISFDEVAYDDFKGKNPQFSIYNSWENPINFKYIKKNDNIAIHLLFLDIYYDLKDAVNITDILKYNLSTKYILLFISMLLIAIIKNITNVLLFIIFGLLDCLNYIFFLLFKICLKIKFLIKRIKIKFIQNSFLLPFKMINYLLLTFFTFIIINLKTLANLINKIFKPITESSDFLLKTNENFTVKESITRYQVNRDTRSTEHIDLLNEISKATLQKLQQLSKTHKLDYLKKIDFKEIITTVDYEKMPDGIIKDAYMKQDLQERENIKSTVTTMLLKDYAKKHNQNYSKIQDTVEKYNNIDVVKNGIKQQINLLKNKKLKDKISTNDELLNELSNQLEIVQ